MGVCRYRRKDGMHSYFLQIVLPAFHEKKTLLSLTARTFFSFPDTINNGKHVSDLFFFSGTEDTGRKWHKYSSTKEFFLIRLECPFCTFLPTPLYPPFFAAAQNLFQFSRCLILLIWPRDHAAKRRRFFLASFLPHSSSLS